MWVVTRPTRRAASRLVLCALFFLDAADAADSITFYEDFNQNSQITSICADWTSTGGKLYSVFLYSFSQTPHEANCNTASVLYSVVAEYKKRVQNTDTDGAQSLYSVF